MRELANVFMSMLLCGACAGSLEGAGHTGSSDSAPTVEVRLERLVTSAGAGLVRVAERIDPELLGEASTVDDYSGLWDGGYFDAVGHRLIHLVAHDLVALMTPKHRVQHLMVGDSYRTSDGLGVGSSLSEVVGVYGELVLENETLDAGWIYRPELLPLRGGSLMNFGPRDQPGWRPLQCVARTSRLQNVSFHFEDCEAANSGAPVSAVWISSSDNSDMQPVDPFLDLSSPPPCPTPRTDDSAELARRGLERLRENKMGEYHSGRSVRLGLPMLRDAALSGSAEAGSVYAGMVFTYVHQEVMGDPLGRVLTQGAQEALFFRILNSLRAPEPPPMGSCRAALIDFDTPISEELFADSDDEAPPPGVCGGQYQFHWLSMEDIEAIRQQARAWSTCWTES